MLLTKNWARGVLSRLGLYTPPPPSAGVALPGATMLARTPESGFRTMRDRGSSTRLTLVLAAVLGAAPAAAQTVSITSTPANGTHYLTGEAITTRLSGFGAVHGTASGDFRSTTMDIEIGGTTRQASVTSGCCSGFTTADFSYTVRADDYDADGISIPANSISGPAWRGLLRGSTVARNHAALANQDAHKVAGGGTPRLVPVATPRIETVAGASVGYSGDGGPASAAGLYEPNFIAIDADGDLYMAEVGNDAIRKVDISTGVITTVAGGRGRGYSGDGGPATNAQLRESWGVAVDAEKNLYITDNNHRIRKVDGDTGIITTVAGTGAAGYSGDGGQATAAQLNGPYGITTDRSGNVYWTEYSNFVVRKLDVETGTISTFAGTGSAGFSGDGGPATAAQLRSPWGLAFDASGNLYIADATGTQRVRKVDAVTGIITTVAGNGDAGYSGDGGLGTAARIGSVDGLVTDTFGNLYITQFDEHVVRKLDARTGIITTIAGTGTESFGGDGGPATAALFQHPAGLAFGRGLTDLYIADRRNSRIRKVGLYVWEYDPPVLDDDTPNFPPRALGIADVALDVGQTVEVDLDAAFSDSGALRYAASANGDAVEAWMSGGALRLRGVRPGQATVTATATDPQGLSASTTFAVRVGTMLSLRGNPAAPEGGGAVLWAELSQPLETDVEVRWRLAADGDLGTADADAADFAADSGTATIAAGETRARIALEVLDDDDIEPAREHFAVELEEPEDRNVGLSARARRAPGVVQEGVCDRTPEVRAELSRGWRGCHWPRPSDLADRATLDLRGRGVSALRSDDLLGLSGLQTLDLGGNELLELPAGLFAGVSGLLELRLSGNPGAPFALAPELRRTDAAPWADGPATVEAHLPLGAPFAMRLALTAAGGEASAEELALAAGAVASGTTSVSGDGPVRVASAAPAIPNARCGDEPCFNGLASEGSVLTLFAAPPRIAVEVPPADLLGAGDVRIDLSAHFAAGGGGPLTYSATVDDPRLASASVDGSVLTVAANEDGEEGAATVTVVATDETGRTAALRFQVEVSAPARHWRGWRSTIPTPAAQP